MKKPTKQAPPLSEQMRGYLSALGSMGGKKGGLARAKNLTPARRREIARKAAQARWSEK